MREAEGPRGENGSAMIITVLMLALLLVLGTGLLATATMESNIAANDRWSEGAFYAAEAAVQRSMDELTQDPSTAVTVPATNLAGLYTYRGGRRTDASAQPPQNVGTIPAPSYSVGGGTGYNLGGFVFEVYQINGTGTGPRNAQREVEVQVEIGPIAH